MDASDDLLDPNTAESSAVRNSRELRGEASSPCVDRDEARLLAERMASGVLSADEIRGPARQLVRHLLRGCPDCAIVFGLAAGWQVDRLPLFRYEAHVTRAIRLSMEVRSKKLVERRCATALLAEARTLRREDPEFGIQLLGEALGRLEAHQSSACSPIGEAHLGDLVCEIHTERANLLRLLGRHQEAEFAFRAAIGCSREGDGAVEALLNLGDCYGSFLIDRRRFGEADRLLAHLIASLAQRGKVAHGGKLALMRSLAAAYSGDASRALHLAFEALRLLSRAEGTLELQLNALQLSIAWNIELGNFQDALDCADAIRSEYHRHMGEGDRTRFLWADARIFYGLRRRGIAERLLRRVKAQFERLGLPFDAALVGLDLAVLLVERRRSAEARALILNELLPTFRSVGVAREGIASLLLLERATEAAALDAALLKSVLRDLERAGKAVGPKREADADGEGSDSA